MLNRGVWKGQRLVSDAWVEASCAPCPLNAAYGKMWWLNTQGEFISAASSRSYFGLGVGSQVLWIDPEHELVVVTRWIEKEAVAEFGARIIEAFLD